MVIRISQKDAIKEARLSQRIPSQASTEESHLARLMKIHILTIVEDAFYVFRNKERTDKEIDFEWKKFKRILENKL